MHHESGYYFFMVAFGGVLFLVFWSLRELCQLATLMFLVCVSQVKIIPLRNFNFIFLSWKKNYGATSIVAIQPLLEPTKLAQWQFKYARVMTWILGSVDQLIVFNLRPYKTAQDMWKYLKKVYNQDNTTKHFQLEYDIANYSQGNLSIQDYFYGFKSLWAKLVDIVYAKVPTKSLSVVQEVHEQRKRDKFMMKLRSEFEVIPFNLMNCASSSSLDVCFGELLREEQHLATQTTL